MSWLRRLFGGRDDGGDDFAREYMAQEERRHAEARVELVRILRELGARSALVRYDGGHDEGSVTEIRWSREPLPGDPLAWTEPRLPGAEEQVEIDWNHLESDPPGLFDAAEGVVASVYDGFAGPFFVKGRLVVDVDGDRIARHDDLWLDDEEMDEDAYEARYGDDEQPKVPPDEHEAERV
ncbi:MAG TPA: hypothetical protein VM290_04960 [Gaiellaceae bacterium]|nr:hypothetical protein [Gaiellaceae bacterium]